MIYLERHSLYRVELSSGSQYWLIRAGRPSAPNPDGPACDLAEMIFDAKVRTLLRSALAELGEAEASAEFVANACDVFGDALESLHGGAQLVVWAVPDGIERPYWSFHVAEAEVDAATFEAAIDRLVELDDLDFRYARQPAQRFEVRTITEADYDLRDCVAFVVHDVLWLERAYGRRWLDEGSSAWEQVRAPSPASTKAELDAAVLACLERYIEELIEVGAWRSLAFEISELLPFDRKRAIELGEVVVSKRAELDAATWKSVCWALGYAIASTKDWETQLADVVARWRKDPSFAEVVAQIDEQRDDYD